MLQMGALMASALTVVLAKRACKVRLKWACCLNRVSESTDCRLADYIVKLVRTVEISVGHSQVESGVETLMPLRMGQHRLCQTDQERRRRLAKVR